MEAKNSSNHSVVGVTRGAYKIDYVHSKDGTTIGYRQYGQGPGLVLVQGAMGSAQNFAQFAEALAGTFTVYVPDRRGRGMSELPFSDNYRLQKDIDDLEALLSRSGAHLVFGLSSGAIIALQAALTLPAIHKLAIFEPPLFSDNLPAALLARYQREISQGKLAAALITGMKAAQMGPPLLNAMPGFLLQPMVKRIMHLEEEQGSGDYLSMKILAPSLQYDFHIVAEMSGQLQRFRDLKTETLLLGGSKSPAYLKDALDELEKLLLRATRLEFPGLDHGAAWTRDRQRNSHGEPETVAHALSRFFTTA